MIIRLATLMLALALALVHTPAVTAQNSTVDQSWAAVMALSSGTKVSVRMKTGEAIQGKVSSVSETALTLRCENTLTDLERDRIQKVSRIGGRAVGKSTLIGLGIGAGTGAAIGGVIAASDRPHESGEAALPVLHLGAAGALIGTITGLASGLFRRQRVLIYEAK